MNISWFIENTRIHNWLIVEDKSEDSEDSADVEEEDLDSEEEEEE